MAMGCGTDLCLAKPIPPIARPLREACRHSRSASCLGLHFDLLEVLNQLGRTLPEPFKRSRCFETKGLRELIALSLVRAHVAAARVLFIRARHSALIGFQQSTSRVSTTIRIACIDCRTSRGESHGLRRATITLQGAKHRVGVVQIAGAVEIATAITAQVMSL